MQRRGFLQLLGLGAAGATAGLPLFGTESIVSATHLPLVAEHLVISQGRTRGVVETIRLDGTLQKFRMGRRPTEPAPDGSIRIPPWVYLSVRENMYQKTVVLRDDQDPYVEFHVHALELQQTLQRQALALLGSRDSLEKTLVTVDHPVVRGVTMICSDCNKETGNENQGHYWRFCHLTQTLRDYHFCCPGKCNLGPPSPDEVMEPVFGPPAKDPKRKGLPAKKVV